jgi:hypothetical protein
MHPSENEPKRTEIELRPEQRRCIETINTVLKQELQELGIKQVVEIKPSQFHFVPYDQFQEVTQMSPWEALGVYDAVTKEIYIVDAESRWRIQQKWEPEQDRLEDYVLQTTDQPMDEWVEEHPEYSQDEWDAEYERVAEVYLQELNHLQETLPRLAADYENIPTMVHEAVHAIGKNKPIHNGKELNVRTGLMLVSKPRSGTNEWREYFVSLNEAIVEKMTMEILAKYKEQFIGPNMPPEELVSSRRVGQHFPGSGDLYELDSKELFPQDEEDISLNGGSYEGDREILDLILKGIAAKNHESFEEVWLRFKRSYLTGNIMHLRDVEDAFGTGSLRVYANLLPEMIIKTENVDEWDTDDNDGDTNDHAKDFREMFKEFLHVKDQGN